MENIVDRKAYRRNSYNEIYEREKIPPKKRTNNLFLNKVINSMLVLLFVLVLKLFYFENEFNFIKEKFNSGYSYNYIKEIVKEKYLSNINNEKENIDLIHEETLNISGEQINIEAIEGVNQLMDDSKMIKENFKIIKPLEGTITSGFGCRESNSPIVSSYHKGLDIAANEGTNIKAAHGGKVIQAGENGTYGKSITIESGDLVTLYAHCSSILKKEGDILSEGEIIGKVGMTGNATGPHLHFEVIYKGRVVNPEDII